MRSPIGYSRVGAKLKLFATSGAMLATLTLVVAARAQDAHPAGAALPVPAAPAAGSTRSDEDRRAAHEQYEQGKAAFAAGDYLRAASLFLAAYRLAPHHDPLWNAARAFELAGERAKAANLYLLYLEIAPVEARDRDRATAARTELAGALGRLEIQGHAQGVRVDDEPAIGSIVFVNPGQHFVRGILDGHPVESLVTVSAGATLSVALETTPASVTPSPPPANPLPARSPVPDETQSGSSGRPLPPLVVYLGGALTLVAVGLTIGSGVDTINKKNQYEEAPSAALYSDGQFKQDRTNVLFWTTLGLGVTTAGLGLFLVHWNFGHGKIKTSASVGPGSVWLGGHF
jgi:tetratricopeptide (TPR) repeat protein